MKKWRIALAVVVVLLSAVGVTGAVLWARAPQALRVQIETSLAESCDTCHVEIGAIELGFGHFEFRDVKFSSGLKGAFESAVTFASLSGQLSLRPLLHHHVVFHDVVARDLDVHLTDGDVVPPKKEDKKEAENAPPPKWSVLLREGRVENAKFLYTRNHKGTSATLHIHDIQASIDAVGNTPEARERVSTMLAKFQIEHSGAIELRLGVPFFVKPLKIDVHLNVKEQNLADLNPFFDPNAGVDLKGTLHSGEADSEVRGAHVKSHVRVEYEDFDLSLKSDYERSGFAAFFENLGADIVMSKANLDKSKEDQSATIEAERKPDESIVSFILQSLKSAAIKVTRQ